MRRSSSTRLLTRAALPALLTLLAIGGLLAQQTPSDKFIVKPLRLPGANGLVMLDYFAYDHGSRRLWVPAANTGSVDVIDTTTDQIHRIEGFPVTQVEFKGKQRAVGPSSVAIGEGVVFVGSRADSRICIIDARTLKLGKCIAFAPASAGLGSAPDGLMYIAATHELWATSGAPPVGIPAADRSIKILAASPADLTPSGKIPLPGSAEGYAVDNTHGASTRISKKRARRWPSTFASVPSCRRGGRVRIPAASQSIPSAASFSSLAVAITSLF